MKKTTKNMVVGYAGQRGSMGSYCRGILKSVSKNQHNDRLYDVTIQTSENGDTETVTMIQGDLSDTNDNDLELSEC